MVENKKCSKPPTSIPWLRKQLPEGNPIFTWRKSGIQVAHIHASHQGSWALQKKETQGAPPKKRNMIGWYFLGEFYGWCYVLNWWQGYTDIPH